MKPNPNRIGKGLDANAEVPDARAEKIAEVQAVLRGSVGKVLKGKEREKIDVLMKETSWGLAVAACETPQDFLSLFEYYGISEDVWRNTGKFQRAGYGSLYTQILIRFKNKGGWAGFLAFMPPPTKQHIDASILNQPYSKQVAACETPDDFLQLFALHKIPEYVWRNSQNLSAGFSKPIFRRFQDQGGWAGFLAFMPPPTKQHIDASILNQPYSKQVAACETPDDFLQLFALHKLPEDVWRNPRKLQIYKYSGLYSAILNHFKNKGGWAGFLALMPPPTKQHIDASILNQPYSKQVVICETPEDFLQLFALHKIPKYVWRNSGKLINEGYRDLYRAIFKRFKIWQDFLDFMDGKDEATLDAKIESLNLEDAIALLAHNPSKLKVFLATSCSELTPEEIDRLVSHSFKHLHARRVYDYSNFKEELAAVRGIEFPKQTVEAAACIIGNAPGADSVLVENNVSTRRIKVATDGTFTGRISLEIGEKNNLRITPINHEKKQIGPIAEVAIYQTGEPDDIGALVALLNQMGVEALESIKSDPGRHEYVVRQAEQALIRKFSGTFAKGKDYVEKLIAESKSSSVRKILKAVLKRFTAIDNRQHPNIKKGHPLYFFQKYCVAEIQRAMEEGRYGICLANDPGLGKTRTALVAINGDPATIITPNSVVTSWAEEAQRALIDNDLLVLREMHSKDRKELLRTSSARHCVTNVDFLRSTEGDERYNLLSNEDTIVVQDEAHGLLNLSSKQSIGARRLKSKFLLLLTATPAKDSSTLRRILHLLDPSDSRFKSDKAFAKAFPGDDPKALRTLHVIKQQYMIRFTKEDALETMDPALSLSKQRHCLPKKEYVPQTQMGGYTLTEDQCQATYELFLNFSQWTQKYDQHVPKDAIAREDQLRGNSNALVKSHALRQTANNPSYIGSKKPDPKGKEMMKAVDAMLAEGRKVVIFCQYISQAQKYAELLKVHCPSVYTGLTSKQGDRTGPGGKLLLYKKNSQGAWVMDSRGLPQEDPHGEPMSTLDYERLAFQNAPERRVMIATYAAGSVGVTFTAGKATIFDDLPEDVIREIQAEDRTHRIDHEHQTHHSVKYVKMLAHYPKSFLERMKKTWVRKNTDGTYFETDDPSVSFKEAPIDADYTNEIDTAYNFFFAQGTYDEVRLAGLKTQRTRFRLINDGIADESELPEIKNLVA